MSERAGFEALFAKKLMTPGSFALSDFCYELYEAAYAAGRAAAFESAAKLIEGQYPALPPSQRWFAAAIRALASDGASERGANHNSTTKEQL